MTTYQGPPSGAVHTTPLGRHLVIERTYRAAIKDVWSSLTEPERVARWYGTIEGVPSPGNTITITMTAEEGAPTEAARIIECEPPRRFIIELAVAGEPWRLMVELDEADGHTTMTFTQRLAKGLDPADIGPGWEFYADRHHAALNDEAMPQWSHHDYRAALGPHYDLE